LMCSTPCINTLSPSRDKTDFSFIGLPSLQK